MRTAFLCLCVLGLTIVANGQSVTPPPVSIQSTAPAAILKARVMEVGVVPQVLPGGETAVRSRVVAKGDVEIRIGSSLVTADEAEIRYGAPGEQDEVELRGYVRLKADLKVE